MYKEIPQEMSHLPELKLEDVALHAKPIEVAEVSFGGRPEADLLYVAGLCKLVQDETLPHLVYTEQRPLDGRQPEVARFVSAEHIAKYNVKSNVE